MINSGPLNGPNAMAVNERLLELLAEAGLKPADAARTAYLLFVYVVGSVALLITDAEGPGLPPEAERIAARRQVFAATPADAFPRAAAAPTRALYVSTGSTCGVCTDSSTASSSPPPPRPLPVSRTSRLGSRSL